MKMVRINFVHDSVTFKDEGHAPSVDLKTEVARAFTKAGKQVPFDTTDLVLAVAQPVKVQEVAMETPKKTTKKIKGKFFNNLTK